MATRKYKKKSSYRRRKKSSYRRRKKSSKRRRKKSSKRRRKKTGGLSRWFNEKWVDVCTGKPCGRKKYSKKGMPYCRPSRRVSKNTPKTRRQLSKKKIRQMCRKKRKNPTKRMKKV